MNEGKFIKKDVENLQVMYHAAVLQAYPNRDNAQQLTAPLDRLLMQGFGMNRDAKNKEYQVKDDEIKEMSDLMEESDRMSQTSS